MLLMLNQIRKRVHLNVGPRLGAEKLYFDVFCKTFLSYPPSIPASDLHLHTPMSLEFLTRHLHLRTIYRHISISESWPLSFGYCSTGQHPECSPEFTTFQIPSSLVHEAVRYLGLYEELNLQAS